MPLRIALSLIVLALSGCAMYSQTNDSYSGPWQVVDVASNAAKPVPDAMVLVTYVRRALAPGHSSAFCESSHLLRADAEGRFDVPSDLLGGDIRIVVHKRGFAAPTSGLRTDAVQRRVLLTSGASRAERNSHYRNLQAMAVCRGSASVKFLAAIVSEVEEFAQSSDEVELVKEMRSSIQILR